MLRPDGCAEFSVLSLALLDRILTGLYVGCGSRPSYLCGGSLCFLLILLAFPLSLSLLRLSATQGLGLPLARQIIEGHGGSLEVVSEPGEGTAAIVDLP